MFEGNVYVCLLTESSLTEEQMEAANIAPKWRDYCAGDWVEFLKCRRDYFPWVIACKPYRHQWEECQNEEYVK